MVILTYEKVIRGFLFSSVNYLWFNSKVTLQSFPEGTFLQSFLVCQQIVLCSWTCFTWVLVLYKTNIITRLGMSSVSTLVIYQIACVAEVIIFIFFQTCWEMQHYYWINSCFWTLYELDVLALHHLLDK